MIFEPYLKDFITKQGDSRPPVLIVFIIPRLQM